jgi:preprotein translocase SecE subunit
VTWPSREELKGSTKVVLVATFIMMLYLFVIDRILTFLLNLVIR